MRYFFAFLLSTFSLWSLPSQVILMRHGEKPPEGNYLSLKGRERAAALVPCFLGFPALLHYGPPAAIYAMKSSPLDPSIRSEQTMMFLADELNLPIQNEFGYRETEQLVEKIKNAEEYEGKMVIICWSHTELPKLAMRLGAKNSPKRWSEEVFDRFWILTFEDDGSVSFVNLPQKLLYGDSSR
jgi:hypothetical protein